MNYVLHPEAALEHEQQVTYYEARSSGLGRRYHAAFCASLQQICEAPRQYRVVQAPSVRRTSLREFPFSIFFREVGDSVEVLAIAPHRKRPGYWTARL